MTTDAPRALQDPAKVVESARCNQCDRVIVAITTAGPGEHRAQCGHAVGSHSLAELATSCGAEDDDMRRAVDSSEELVPDGGSELSVGTRVRTTRDFSGVPEGTEGVVDEDYGSGIMVAWDLPGRSLPDDYDRLPEDESRLMTTGPDGSSVPILRDGFDIETELRFLEAVDTDSSTISTGGGRDESAGDPHHIDPAGDVADLFESGEIDAELAEDTDEADLREFIERAEAGEFGEADPGLNAAVRIVRALLDDDSEGGEA